ncbi:ABC transporter ATP-binding protein [Paracrocinitomix mangrovi]|uniref:ABC transporter ATP-binding protein n=1 Tax=Paracrocinitomix mangrovi TaxID=2862509 RepID=UPI001C8E13A1|nr:ABC transporter ATP-binding protein [Paracrocinitomix mangrovi]UKN01829.1 ABC transporter ATP-binding protein [Paracrocinitomix mangrovi]
MSSILSIKNLSVGYDKNKVVKKCNFELQAGEIAVILGASGDGKTTLLKAIAGFLPHQEGEVTFKGEKIKDSTQKLIPGNEEIRLVNQDFELDVYHTVEENIKNRLLRFDGDYQEQRVKSMLRITKLTRFRNYKALEISGGQQQRLAIARALADEPELLLLDEPFNQLDFQTKSKISNHIRKYLKKNNIAALMVTHNGIEAMEWADKIIYMEKGKIKRIDEPQAFFEQPSSKREASFFGELNRLKIGEEELYFRPSFFSSEKTKSFSKALQVDFVQKQNLGWYSIFTFVFKGQEFNLFSTEDISGLSKIFIKPINFID